jgi:hypothetical protein
MATENGIQAGKAFVLIRGMDTVTYQFSEAIKSRLAQNPDFKQLPVDQQDEIVASVMQTKAVQAIVGIFRAHEEKIQSIFGACFRTISEVNKQQAAATRELCRVYRKEVIPAEKRYVENYSKALKESQDHTRRELATYHLDYPESIEEWLHLARVVEMPPEWIRTLNLTPAEICDYAIRHIRQHNRETKHGSSGG